MQFNWLDYTFLALISCSILISLVRGFVSELCSLINWIVAIWLSFYWYEPVTIRLPDVISSPSLRVLIGIGVVFVLILLAGSVLSWVLAQLVAKTGLGGTDRLLGMVFGGLRGILIVTLFIMLARLTPLPKEAWWKASVLTPYFQPLEHWLQEILPNTITQYIKPNR